MLADSSHRCIMITGDNPLTAVHVAEEVEIIDRDALILDLRENPSHPGGTFESLRHIGGSGLTNCQTLFGRQSTTLRLSQSTHQCLLIGLYLMNTTSALLVRRS